MPIILVDGAKLRNTLDVDFTAIGDNSIYPYIKSGEIWLEKIYREEAPAIIKNFKKKKSLIKKIGYEKAKAKLRLSPKIDAKSASVYLKKIKKNGQSSVYLVAGAKARAALDPNFFLGGHDLIYKYIPKNEIWIDNAVSKKEIEFILEHELYERNLMKRGKSYNNAHDCANAREKELRRASGAKYPKD